MSESKTETGSFKVDLAEMKRKTKENQMKIWRHRISLIWSYWFELWFFPACCISGIVVVFAISAYLWIRLGIWMSQWIEMEGGVTVTIVGIVSQILIMIGLLSHFEELSRHYKEFRRKW